MPSDNSIYRFTVKTEANMEKEEYCEADERSERRRGTGCAGSDF